MQDNETLIFTNNEITDVPPWKLVDEALRKMAVLSQHENSLSDYAKMKEQYQ
jgi:hypothetical protein